LHATAFWQYSYQINPFKKAESIQVFDIQN